MCFCTRLAYCFGNIFYVFEKLVSWCALASVVTCLITTLLIMLALGIGLGYNYCYIDMETARYKEVSTIYVSIILCYVLIRNATYICSFLRIDNEQVRHSTSNASIIPRKGGNGIVLKGTEWFTLGSHVPSTYSAVYGIQRQASKRKKYEV